MGRKGNYNPVEAHRKAMHKREVKKNKEERRKQRESKLEKANLTELREQVEHYTALEAEDRLDAVSRKKFEQAKSRLQKATKIQQELRQNRPRNTNVTYSSSAAAPVIPKDPTRSIYYHPTLNPYGVPPPGQPYREIDDGNEDDINNEAAISSDTDDDGDDASNSESDDIPELPPESPPAPADSSNEKENEDDEDDLPDLPEGTPPPLPSEVEERDRTMVNPPINPPPMPYAMLPPFYHNMHYPLPPPPMMMYRGHPPPPPPPPQRVHNPRMPPAMMDPLNPEEPYQLFPQSQPRPPPPPRKIAPTPTTTAATASNATISAQPQLRDLQKELTTLIPTAVRRKMEGSAGSTRHRDDDDNRNEPSLTAKRMRVNTAPGLNPPATTTSASVAQPVAKPTSTNNGKTQPTTRLQDEYSNFMKEMEGLL